MTARLGLPWHGLVEGGGLIRAPLPLLPYPQPTGGSTVLVRHPAAPTIVRSPTEIQYDTQQGYQWVDYALLSGSRRQIGGQDLGATNTNRWLYCDATGCTWIMDLIVSAHGTNPDAITLELRLVRRFGLMSGSAASINRTLDNVTVIASTVNPTLADGLTLSNAPSRASILLATQQRQTVPSPSGAKALVHVGYVLDPPTVDPARILTRERLLVKVGALHLVLTDLYEIALSGAGADINDTTGAAITGTVSSIGGGSAFAGVILDPAVDQSITSPDLFTGYTCSGSVPNYVATPNPPDPDYTGRENGYQYDFALQAYYDGAETVQFVRRRIDNYVDHAKTHSVSGNILFDSGGTVFDPVTECSQILQFGHNQGGNNTVWTWDYNRTQTRRDELVIGGVVVSGWQWTEINASAGSVAGVTDPTSAIAAASTTTQNQSGVDAAYGPAELDGPIAQTANIVSVNRNASGGLPGFTRLSGLPLGELTVTPATPVTNATLNPATGEIHANGALPACWV